MGTSLRERGKAVQASAAKFDDIQCPHLLCAEDLRIGSCIIVMIIAVKGAVKGVHEKVINYLKHKNSTMLSSPPV